MKNEEIMIKKMLFARKSSLGSRIFVVEKYCAVKYSTVEFADDAKTE